MMKISNLKHLKQTKEYKDSVFEKIDIEEAINKSKIIKKCPIDKFLYSKFLRKVSKEGAIMSYSQDDLNFEKDNGKIIKFTEFYEMIDILGNGSFGVVISAFDKVNKYEKVAIKVFKSISR